MSPDSIQSFFALAIGFALAGVLATGYQLATYRPAGFHLLERGPGLAAPFLAFAAPFIIMRNTLRGHELEGRSVTLVLAATVISGFWSLMSGSLVVMALASLEALRI